METGTPQETYAQDFEDWDFAFQGLKNAIKPIECNAVAVFVNEVMESHAAASMCEDKITISFGPFYAVFSKYKVEKLLSGMARVEADKVYYNRAFW